MQELMITGRVYKLTNPNCDKCYIGSSKSKYISIRMAHHRERHHKGRHNYQGLFEGGDPKLEILEEIKYPQGQDWMLRCKEQWWWEKNKENSINIRRCWVSPEDQRILRDQRVKRYHESPKGRLAVRKATINSKLKNPNVTGLKRCELQKELKLIIEKQNALREEENSSSCEVPEAIPPEVHQDLSDEV